MTEKKEKTKKNKPVKTKTKTVKDKSKKQTKSKNKTTDIGADFGIVIIDDELEIDKDAVNAERRAYLEEARSQEVSD